jgi:hypothetical protein
MMSLDPNIFVDELLKESATLRKLASAHVGGRDEVSFQLYMGGAVLLTSLAAAMNKTLIAQVKASQEEELVKSNEPA